VAASEGPAWGKSGKMINDPPAPRAGGREDPGAGGQSPVPTGHGPQAAPGSVQELRTFVSNASAWGLIGSLARFGNKGGPLPADSSPRGNPKLCQWGPGVRGRVLTQISIKNSYESYVLVQY